MMLRTTHAVAAAFGLILVFPGAAAAQNESQSNIVRLLEAGRPVFGIFSGEHTAERGRQMAGNRELDFVFYSLESGPFDIAAMQAYMNAMREASAGAPHPLVLRIPPIGDDANAATQRVQQAIEAGVGGIVFPHVHSAEQAALAARAMGSSGWPANPGGHLVNMLIVEDREGIASVREIVRTRGVSVVFAGPGDLRRAYEGRMDEVENAIQSVLAACKEYNVPCGITAGVDDIATRLEQGFRVIIVTQPEALTVGRRAAGRTP